MSKQPLLFKRLSILRMPGIPHGLQDYMNFSPHINIIFGPNGSGKSSTARAIKELIWHKAIGDITANAVITLGDEEWELKLDGRMAAARRNGRDESLTGIPAWEGTDRYSLALHELVSALDGDLAQQVIKDSTGYDLDGAQQVLRYAYGAYQTRNKVYQEYIVARDSYNEILRGQDDLKRQQDRLGRLMQDKVDAEHAAEILEWNRQLLEFVRTKQSLAETQARLTSMPAILAKLIGTEYNDLQEVHNQLANLATEVNKFKDKILMAERRRSELNFPEAGLPDTLLNELDGKVSHLTDVEKGMVEHEKEIAKARGRELTALKPLEASHDVSEWAGVTWKDVDVLEEHLQKAHGLLSRKAAVEALILELQRSMNGSPKSDPDNVMAAIRVLTGWLQDIKPETTKTLPIWSLWVITALAILSAVSVLFFGPVGLVTILIVIGTAAFIYFSRKKSSQGIEETRRMDYARIGLPEPSNWKVSSVQKRLGELAEQLASANWHRYVNERVEIHQNELNTLKPDLGEIDRRYKELKDQLLLVPKAPTGDIKSFDAMYWFLRYGREWHEHYSERTALESTYKALVKQRDDALAKINKLLALANANQATDVISAKTALQLLKVNDRTWREAGIEIENAQKGIDDRNPRKLQLTTKLEEIYTKTGIEIGEDHKLSELISQLSAYSQIKQDFHGLEAVREDKERSLRAQALFSVYGSELDTVSIDIIQERISALAMQTANLDQIKTEIAAINARIEDAESGASLEAALKVKDDRLANLEDLYDTNLASVTGKLLIDALKKRADDCDRPLVFRQANTIFSRITNGKYQLRLNTSERPSFGAFNTVEGQWRNLEELSTGTRIQLLLSVRLAFIDSLESSMSVPILADELLANSDLQRTSAIVDTLANISKEGRQIFYFTSKEEEVIKWQEFLADKSDISHSVYVLDGHDNESYTLAYIRPTLEFAGSHLVGGVPEIEDRNHTQYGELLNIGAFDVMSDMSDRLHIWYLFGEPNIIQIILKKGVSHWGQLRSFISVGGTIDGLDEITMEQVSGKIAIFERFQQLYQKGRARRINRSVLENSGAVTSSFIDAVTEKLEEFNNNPLQLLDSLENKGVPGFRTNNLERLKDYLLAEGYISDETELSADDIWVQLSAFISRTPLDLEEAQRFIARILH